MKYALSGPPRVERMRENMRRFMVPRLQPKGIAICGFGPSLTETWRGVAKHSAVMTTSGAHDFLIERGVVPTYHVECDPREHKTKFVQNSHPEVTYLINSVCHPSMFEELERKKRKVLMWHGVVDDNAEELIAAADEIEPGARLLNGGTNAGMRSLPVARELGFTEFDLYGLDCCYQGQKQWAGKHYSQPHRTVRVEVDGQVFVTSDLMMQSTDDFFNTMAMLTGCRFRVHGSGLLGARLRIFNRDRELALSPDWWKPVGFSLRS